MTKTGASNTVQSPLNEQGPTYSTAYSEIVGDDDDLIDMIAYCLYKKQKREFIVRNSLPFNDQRVRRYHDDLNRERIETLRVAAQSRLQTYANLIQEAVRKEEATRSAMASLSQK